MIFLWFWCIVSSSGWLAYSEVKMFLKKQPAIITEYKSITTSANTTIRLSKNHLIYTKKYCNDKFEPMYVCLHLLRQSYDNLLLKMSVSSLHKFSKSNWMRPIF